MSDKHNVFIPSTGGARAVSVLKHFKGYIGQIVRYWEISLGLLDINPLTISRQAKVT